MDHCARYLAFLGTKVFSESCQTARMECCGRIIINSSLFQIFRRFFLRKVWLLIIVPNVSESRKLPVPRCNFGLGVCDIIVTSSEPQKLVLFWTQSKVLKAKWWKQLWTIVFLEKLLKQHFRSKLIKVWRHAIVTKGLWRHQISKTHFCGLR